MTIDYLEGRGQSAVPGGGVGGYGVGTGAFGDQARSFSLGFTSVIMEWDRKRWGSDDFLPDGLPTSLVKAPRAGIYEVTLNISGAIRNTDDSDITDAARWWRISITGATGGGASGISTAGPTGADTQAAGPWNWIETSVSGFGHFDAGDSPGVQFNVEGDVKFQAELVTGLHMVLVLEDIPDVIPPTIAAFVDSISDVEAVTDPADGTYRITGEDWADYTPTHEADEPTELPDGYIGWFKLVLTGTRTVTLATNGSGIADTILRVYDALPTSGASSLFDDDDGGSGTWSLIGPESLTAGSYWIAVAPFDGSGWDTSEAEAHVDLTIST